MPRRSTTKRVKRSASLPERVEVMATVCDYFCHKGLTAPQIQQRMREDHSVEITREEAYRFVRKAAASGWIRFTPPQEYSLHRRIKEETHPWLQDVSVVQTLRSEDVAYRGAKMLLELLQQHYSDREVHLGFSGGYALRLLAGRFAQLLREPTEHLPQKIVFHAMVAGFDVYEPTTDPNAFFTHFVNDASLHVATSFVGLHAPAIVEEELLPRLRQLAGIEEAYAHAHEIDVIVTSASCWRDEHCTLRRYMKLAGEPVEDLEKAGCVGDMLWQPIGVSGPIEMKTAVRAMTIMDLSDVKKFFKSGRQVLLVAGPCGACHTPKTEVVKAILGQKDHLITHLVVDSRCGRELLSA